MEVYRSLMDSLTQIIMETFQKPLVMPLASNNGGEGEGGDILF